MWKALQCLNPWNPWDFRPIVGGSTWQLEPSRDQSWGPRQSSARESRPGDLRVSKLKVDEHNFNNDGLWLIYHDISILYLYVYIYIYLILINIYIYIILR